MKSHHLDFIHKFIPANEKETERRGGKQDKNKIVPTFLLLHGTGGNEEDLIALAREISSEAAILSPRGKVLENNIYPRFFRRLSEGVFDIEDLKFRTNELADFVIYIYMVKRRKIDSICMYLLLFYDFDESASFHQPHQDEYQHMSRSE